MAHDTGPPDPGRRMRGGPCQGRNTLKTAINGNQRDHIVLPIQPQLEGGQEDLLRDHTARMNEAAGGHFKVTLIRPAAPRILSPAVVAAMESWFQWLRDSDAVLTYCVFCDSCFTWEVRLPHVFFFITPDTADPEIGGITGACAECATLPDLELLHRTIAFYGFPPLHKNSPIEGEGLPPPSGQPQGQEENFNDARVREPSPITATPFVWDDPSTLPRRRFVYGRHLVRGYCSCTVAPGGFGKSSLIIAEALAMATGRALLDEQPAGAGLRVWHVNLEDPEDELRRRFAAVALHYDMDPVDVGDRLFLNSGRDTNIVIAKETRNGVEIAVPLIEAIKAEIIKNKIDVLQIDPFVACHSVSENDNTKIAVVAREWALIAEATNCAIELVHHVRKNGGQSFMVEDARGASSLIAAVRSARVINGMTKAEAEKANVENHHSYFSVTNGKSNLTPRSDKATWRHIVGVPLGNGSTAFDAAGDVVGVVTPWSWPDPFADIDEEDAKEVQRRIAAGEWRESPQSTTWAGIVVADVLGLDVAQKAVKERVTATLAGWLASGALSVATRRDKARRERKFIVVGQWIT